MADYRVISADSHVFEPADLWISGIESKFRDSAPRVMREEGFDYWYCETRKLIGVQPGAQTGRRFEEPEKLTRTEVLENVRPGAYIPEEHVKDMAADGVDVSIVYPSVGLMLYNVPDSELLSAIFRCYNSWVAEFCRPVSGRIKGIGMINLDDVGAGVKELERCAKMGLVGAMITAYCDGRPYDLAEYEPFWSAAEDLETPISLHAGTNRPGRGVGSQQFAASSITLSNMVNMDHWVRMSLADMTLTGVFERHPKLQVGAVEFELAWIPYFLDKLDYAYTQKAPTDAGQYRFKENMLPSEYIHRGVFFGFQEDAKGIKDRDIIGVDNVQWGSDYPHQESTFPRSRQILEEILTDCTQDEKAKIAGGNAARVYHL